jgi:uncharacterized protein YjbI with pentapeptide repeats
MKMGITGFCIRNRYNNDKVLFSHMCEDNSMKKTAEAAVAEGINLTEADFFGEDLSGADLSYGRFENADFGNADLSSVNFQWSRLSRANLRGACIFGIDLLNADLRGIIFDGAKWVPEKTK